MATSEKERLTAAELTPMLRQYLGLKEQYQDAILFFRMGDFYEMFFEDAEVAAKALDIALTSRNKNSKSSVPLCGVPYHSANPYIAQLINQGFKVAVCEQVEDPKQAKGLVRREVTKVITPATASDSEMLNPLRSNNLLCLHYQASYFCLAKIDFLAGNFNIFQSKSKTELMAELARSEAAELIYSQQFGKSPLFSSVAEEYKKLRVDQLPEEITTDWHKFLLEHYAAGSLAALGLEDFAEAAEAAAMALAYLKTTQQQELPQLKAPRPLLIDQTMYLDAATRRNLELLESYQGEAEGTLFSLLNKCSTAMGSRLLRHWINYPLTEVKTIKLRLSAVDELLNNTIALDKYRQVLKQFADIERLAARIALKRANPRDLKQLQNNLELVPQLKSLTDKANSQLLLSNGQKIADFSLLAENLAQTIAKDPPLALKNGGIIAQGFNQQLDQLRSIASGGRQWLTQYEAAEREKTGINTLKVRYNKVFGYYIEITRSQLSRVPAEYQRKQTLLNAERFITEQLKDYEQRILSADLESKELEQQLFLQLLAETAQQAEHLQELAEALANIDLLTTFAKIAIDNNYCRAKIVEQPLIKIVNGRHPVVEKLLKGERFVPNSIELDCQKNQLLLISGPNMAGKSTVIRQVALICLMAQIGSFVPADSLELGTIDRIFTRVGASDRLSRGQSTFMVEMTEAANILRQATPRSLIMLDELGRGTSTFDGLSIAWAVSEYLHDTVKAKTLFATHYHELTELARSKERIHNFNISVKEWQGKILFLRQLIPGSASRSYGIEVARLAGLPEKVLARAAAVLKILEEEEIDELGLPRLAQESKATAIKEKQQTDFFYQLESKIVKQLKELDLEQITPLNALNILADLKDIADSQD